MAYCCKQFFQCIVHYYKKLIYFLDFPVIICHWHKMLYATKHWQFSLFILQIVAFVVHKINKKRLTFPKAEIRFFVFNIPVIFAHGQMPITLYYLRNFICFMDKSDKICKDIMCRNRKIYIVCYFEVLFINKRGWGENKFESDWSLYLTSFNVVLVKQI